MKHHVQRVVDHLYGPTGSVILHIVIVILLIKFVTFREKGKAPEVEVMIMEAHAIDLEDLKEIEKELDDIKPPEIDVQVDVYTDVPNPEPVETPTDTMEEAVDLTALDISDAASPLVMRGLFSGRSSSGRAQSLRLYGGNKGTEEAVLKALEWLKKKQLPDGSWESNKIAMAGLGLLTFLAHGETPASEEYGETVEKAIKFLLSQQKSNGAFGSTSSGHAVYAHAIATYSISEAYGMTRIPSLKAAMEGGIDVIIKGQQTGGGWDYGYKKGARRDTSVSGWHVQAMKAAYMSGAENPGIKTAMKRATADMKSVHNPQIGSFGYGSAGGKSPNMTGVGVLSLQFLGQAKSPEVRKGLEALEEVTGDWKKPYIKKNQMYGWYYVTQAKFHKGGDTWSKWNKHFAKTLVENQESDGHWGAPEGGGHGQGAVYTTTLGALMLQVYYRNLPTFMDKAAEAEELPAEGELDEEEVEII